MDIIYADQNGNAIIVCPDCGKKKQANVSKYLGRQPSIKCSCGNKFECRFEPSDMESSVDKRAEYFTLESGELSRMKERVYPSVERGEANIVCDKCGRGVVLNPKDDPVLVRTFGFRCPCGNIFPCRIEQRKQYRRRVALKGSYVNRATRDRNPMTVRDISLGGIGFHAPEKHGVHKDDILEVTFTLDDERETEIKRMVIVKAINGWKIGCEFLEKPLYDRELGFYLMG
jgi:hypothetical protein